MPQEELTGLFQFLHWGANELGPAATSCGIVDGGDIPTNTDPRIRQGIGGNNIRRGGLVKPGGTGSFYLTDTNQGLVEYGIRPAYPRGVLPAFSMHGGSDQWDRFYETYLMNEWGLSYSEGEGLKADITWGALTMVPGLGGGSMADEIADDFEDYEGVISIDAVEYGIQSMDLRVNNNILWKTAADTKVPGFIRQPLFALWGREDLTVSFTLGRPIPYASMGLVADDLIINIGAIATFTNLTNTFTLIFQNLMTENEGFGFVDANTQAGWPIDFIGDSRNGSIASWGWA